MKIKRMTSADRDKQLSLAIRRIEKGRARTKATRLSVASVAREAGVSTALIHNHHPDRAEEIREKQGRSSRAQRDAKHSELKSEKAKNKELRAQNDALRLQITKLASINEILLMEVRTLKAMISSNNVTTLSTVGR